MPLKREGGAPARTSEVPEQEPAARRVPEGKKEPAAARRVPEGKLENWLSPAYPDTVQPILLIWDKSLSMEDYHVATGEFIPAVLDDVKTTLSPRALDRVYLAVVVMAHEGVLTNGFQKLADATDVAHAVNGGTPVGPAHGKAADLLEKFACVTLVSAQSRCLPPVVLSVGDLQALETETPDVTHAGIDKLVALVKKLRGQITVVGPTAELTDQALARRLCGERSARYLGSDPKGVVRVVIDTVTQTAKG